MNGSEVWIHQWTSDGTSKAVTCSSSLREPRHTLTVAPGAAPRRLPAATSFNSDSIDKALNLRLAVQGSLLVRSVFCLVAFSFLADSTTQFPMRGRIIYNETQSSSNFKAGRFC
eukprot:642518-Amphidinium_carterae.1